MFISREYHPDALIRQLVWAIEEMDFEIYEQLFRPDYQFIFTGEDVLQNDLPSDRWGLAEEHSWSGHLFSGESHQTDEGTQPPVGRISLDVFAPLGIWEASSDPAFPPPAWRRLYQFQMTVDRPGGTRLGILGHQLFYVLNADPVAPGETAVTGWKIIGQIDLSETGPKPAEPITWGGLKFLYR